MMGKAFIIISLLVVGVTGAGLPPAASADAEEGSYVTPGSKAAGLESCVRETGFMRRNHMELIKHQRDETVHRGIRTRKHSLVQCVSCHAVRDRSGVVQPVNAPGQFCAACHEYASVRIDCFECHASRPDGAAPISPSGPTADGQASRLRERARLQGPRE